MKNVKVSIVVPCWGVEKYLDRCVESLVNQTLNEIEIILVDDVSPDRVPVMCDEWAQKDARIKVIHKPQNEGLGMACNSGIEIATGEYLAFCDSDDWVEKDMYEKMYNAAKENKAQIVYSGIQRVDSNGNITPMNQATERKVYNSKPSVLGLGMDLVAAEPRSFAERRIAMSAKIALYDASNIRRFFLRFQSERKMISEDLLWNLDNIALADCVVELPYTFYNYFDNSNSITNTVRKDRYPFYKALTEELFQRTRLLGYPKDIDSRIQRMFIGYARHRLFLVCKSNQDYDEKLQQLKEVCEDSYLQKIISNYPIYKMHIKRLLPALLMKYKFYKVMMFVFSR